LINNSKEGKGWKISINLYISIYFVHAHQNESDPQYTRLINFLGVSKIKPPFSVIYSHQKKYRWQSAIIPEVIKVLADIFLFSSFPSNSLKISLAIGYNHSIRAKIPLKNRAVHNKSSR